MERLHEVQPGREAAEHTHSREDTQGETVRDTGQDGSGTAEAEGSHRSTGQGADETDDVPLDIQERQKVLASHPVIFAIYLRLIK